MNANPGVFALGGRSLVTIPCTCMPGFFLVVVGPPCGGIFIYGPPGATRYYMDYNIFPPALQLGRAVGILQCHSGPGCPIIGAGPLVIQVGTSLI